MTVVLLAAGFVSLVLGAELLVRGASRLAAVVGVSPLVIGLTVVAYGTSMPEMAVSAVAGFQGQADIALGNVVGSNIFNILFILGISAVITPLVVSQQLVRLDVPLMVVVSILTLAMGADGRISRLDGLVLFSGLVAYTVFLLRQSRRETQEVRGEHSKQSGGQEPAAPRRWPVDVGLIVIGLVLLVLGSRWLVAGAVSIGARFGISELIVGLTIVAAGTSLPEVATSVVASLRGERDIAVGNVVGSSIFNLLGVLGLSGLVAPDGIGVAASALRFDIPVMIAAAVACLPIFFTGHLIARWEGALFLGYYVAYTLYVVLTAARHPSISVLTASMAWFVIPLTVLTLAIGTVRAFRVRSRVGEA